MDFNNVNAVDLERILRDGLQSQYEAYYQARFKKYITRLEHERDALDVKTLDGAIELAIKTALIKQIKNISTWARKEWETAKSIVETNDAN